MYHFGGLSQNRHLLYKLHKGVLISRGISSVSYYETLELPRNATIKDVKSQFKRLSKKYHPDLNTHLTSEEKESNNNKFVSIVTAYDVLKDSKKRKKYDMELKNSGQGNQVHSTRSEWHNKYYGEALYYSKSGRHTSASGLNSTRNRVHFHPSGFNDKSTFDGRHVNYGDRYNVPHFDYNEHLSRNLKFEQRMINKRLSDEDREQVLKQLSKDGDISKLSEELITKHLMRQAHHTYNSGSSFREPRFSNGPSSSAKNPYMYEGPNDDSGLYKTFIFLGGAFGSIYILYSLFY